MRTVTAANQIHIVRFRTEVLIYVGYGNVVASGLAELHFLATWIYEDNSISKLQIQVANYVFELSAGNSHR
jgi:hypothetical protein